MSAAGEAGLSTSTSDFRQPDPTSTIGETRGNGNSTCTINCWEGKMWASEVSLKYLVYCSYLYTLTMSETP